MPHTRLRRGVRLRRGAGALIALALTCVAFPGATVSCAEDGPAAPPPPPPAEPATSDEAALRLLRAAVERQGGKELADAGALRSFRVEFGRVKAFVEDDSESASGVKSGSGELSEFVIDWLHHDDAASSLRTSWVTSADGKRVAQAVIGTRDAFWISADGVTQNVTRDSHPEDVEQLLAQRRLTEALLDVAVLRKMLADGSVWKSVTDAAHPGTALRREPPKGSGLHLTLWFDAETLDPRWVRVEPSEADAATLHYEFEYDAERPKVSGATLRFPFKTHVFEQKAKDAPLRRTLDLYAAAVKFNTLTLSDFAPPR